MRVPVCKVSFLPFLCQQRHQVHTENSFDYKDNYLQLVLKMQKGSQINGPFYALLWAQGVFMSVPENMQMHKMGRFTSVFNVSAIL